VVLGSSSTARMRALLKGSLVLRAGG